MVDKSSLCQRRAVIEMKERSRGRASKGNEADYFRHGAGWRASATEKNVDAPPELVAFGALKVDPNGGRGRGFVHGDVPPREMDAFVKGGARWNCNLSRVEETEEAHGCRCSQHCKIKRNGGAVTRWDCGGCPVVQHTQQQGRGDRQALSERRFASCCLLPSDSRLEQLQPWHGIRLAWFWQAFKYLGVANAC